jgi:hypothetical protein
MKHTNILHGHNAEFLHVKAGDIYVVAIALQAVSIDLQDPTACNMAATK